MISSNDPGADAVSPHRDVRFVVADALRLVDLGEQFDTSDGGRIGDRTHFGVGMYREGATAETIPTNFGRRLDAGPLKDPRHTPATTQSSTLTRRRAA